MSDGVEGAAPAGGSPVEFRAPRDPAGHRYIGMGLKGSTEPLDNLVALGLVSVMVQA